VETLLTWIFTTPNITMRLMKHYLTLSSLIFILFLTSCSAPYIGLTVQKTDKSIYRFQPRFTKELYRCNIDGRVIFKKFHLSGLLFFKELQNGTIRAIFQNELGPTLFDFEWDGNGNFKVNQVIEQLNKEAITKTLKKDIEMLLMIGMDKNSEILLTRDRGKEEFSRLNINNGFVYYITEADTLKRIENANNRKRVVTVNVGKKSTTRSMPDAISINHHKANFTISLTKLESDVNE
jgi:hypothetical protein